MTHLASSLSEFQPLKGYLDLPSGSPIKMIQEIGQLDFIIFLLQGIAFDLRQIILPLQLRMLINSLLNQSKNIKIGQILRFAPNLLAVKLYVIHSLRKDYVCFLLYSFTKQFKFGRQLINIFRLIYMGSGYRTKNPCFSCIPIVFYFRQWIFLIPGVYAA